MRSERFMSVDDIKRSFDCSKKSGGVVVHYESPDRIYTSNGEAHTLILGTTGCGKTRRAILPLLYSLISSEKKESFTCLDAKSGELFKMTSGMAEAKGYEVRVVNFNDLSASESFNPLAMPYRLFSSKSLKDQQKAADLLGAIANCLYPDNRTNDIFWPTSSRELWQACCYTLFYDGTPDTINIPSIYRIIAQGSRGKIGSTTLLKRYVDHLPDNREDKLLYQTYLNAPSDTAMSIRACVQAALSPYIMNKGIRSLVCGDDFNILDLNDRKPLAIYIILPDQAADVYAAQAAMLINQLVLHFIDLAHQNANDRLRRRMNIVVEELGSLGHALENLCFLMAAGRSRGIRLHCVLQDIAQLTDLYGQAKASTIRSNADIILFRNTNLQTLNEFSELCGRRAVKRTEGTQSEPLLTAAQLQQMSVGQALVLSGKAKFVFSLPDVSLMFPEYNQYPPIKLPESHIINPQLFDLETSDSPVISSSFPFNSPGNATSQSSMGVDAIIENIDRRIAEIEKEEAELRANEGRTKKSDMSKFKVVLAMRGPRPLQVAEELVRCCPSVKREDAILLVARDGNTLVSNLDKSEADRIAMQINTKTHALAIVVHEKQ